MNNDNDKDLFTAEDADNSKAIESGTDELKENEEKIVSSDDNGEAQDLTGGENDPDEKETKDDLSGIAENPAAEDNDNWQFEASAPTLESTLIDGDEFEIEIPSAAEQKIQKQVIGVPTSAEKTSAPKKASNPDIAKFVLSALLVLAIGFLCGMLGNQYYNQPNTTNKTNPGNVALTVGDEDITVGMYNFYYNRIVEQYESYSSQLGLDTTKDYSKQTVTDDDGKQTTWDKVFVDQTVKQIQRTVSLYLDAVDSGMTLSKSQKDDIKTQLKSYSDSAEDSGMSVDDYVVQNCGEYCGYETLKDIYYQSYLAENYYYQTYVNASATDEEIDDYFKKNGENECYSVGFSYLTVSYTGDDTDNYADGEVRSQKQAKSLANDCQKEISSQKDTKSKVKKLESYISDVNKSDAESYFMSGYFDTVNDALDYLVTQSSSSATKSDESLTDEINEWLFSSDSSIGDVKMFEDEDNTCYYVIIKTGDSALMEDDVYTVRHILIQATGTGDNSEITDDDIKTAEDSADDVLKQYNSGDKSETSFALLAEDYSSDTSTTSSGSSGSFGGLYSTKAGESTDAFDKWVTDKSRKEGDVGKVYVNDYYTGYHLIYFKNKQPEWKYICENAIVSEKQEKIMDDSTDKHKVTLYDRIMDKTEVAKPSSSSSSDSSSSSGDNTASSEETTSASTQADESDTTTQETSQATQDSED